MARFREDERFKSISPDSIVMPYPTPAFLQPSFNASGTDEVEIWFDWAFVDFWKSNYCKWLVPLLSASKWLIWVNRYCATRVFDRPWSIVALLRCAIYQFLHLVYSRFDIGQSAESAMLIASLRDVIRQQSAEIEALQIQLKETKAMSNNINSSQVWCNSFIS